METTGVAPGFPHPEAAGAWISTAGFTELQKGCRRPGLCAFCDLTVLRTHWSGTAENAGEAGNPMGSHGGSDLCFSHRTLMEELISLRMQKLDQQVLCLGMKPPKNPI